MSWTTGTQTEALSCANVNGTQLTNVSTQTLISPAEGAAYTPANFWLPTYGASKGILVKAYGVVGVTATPNLTIALIADTTQGTAGTVVATTTAVAAPAAGSNMPWTLEVIVSVAATGSSGTFLADGNFTAYPTTTSVYNARCSSSAANPNTAVTLSTQSAYYWELWGTFSAASASNNITVYGYTVLGLN